MGLQKVLTVIMMAGLVLLAGCRRPDSVTATGSCSGGSNGFACKGEVSLRWELRSMFDTKGMYVTSGIDPSLFALDTSSSTTTITGTSGNVYVEVEMPGSVTHNQTFGWTRSGSLIVPQNPTAVANWLSQYWDDAVDIRLEFLNIDVAQNSGANLVVLEAVYDGVIEAGDTVSWYNSGSGGCPFPPCHID
jgi:hypothetical protein